jgi:monoamine oxidase
MARTPLFRSLERSLRLARLSLATGRPAAELAGELRERRRAAPPPLTRRDFLRSTAVAAVGLGVAGCRLPRPAPAPPGAPLEVLIAGGGIAGLTAAYRLHQQGVAVRLLEAQERVGGRMFSLRGHFADGQVAELGGELIDSGHTHIRALAEELGIGLDDLHAGEAMDEELWNFAGRRWSDAEVVEAFVPVAARIDADLATLAEPWATYDQPNGAEALDRTTLRQWLAQAPCEAWFRTLLDVAYTGEYGLETDRQSALNLHFMIDTEPDPFRIFGDSDERFHVQGGNDRIPLELARRLDGVVDTGSRLEAVRRRADGAFECSVRRGGASHTVAAPHLVLALPFTLLREVELDLELPAVKRRAIAELGYGTNAKLMVGFDARPWRTRHGSNGSVVTDLGFQSTWETSRKQPGDAGILTNFTGGDHGVELGGGTAAEQAAALVAGLESVYPGISAARPGMAEARFHWPSHRWTRGSYACYLPGQWTGVCGAEGERVGNLHFIGEHCSLDAQGFMEGGCETGERAARDVLADLRPGSVQPAGEAAA